MAVSPREVRAIPFPILLDSNRCSPESLTILEKQLWVILCAVVLSMMEGLVCDGTGLENSLITIMPSLNLLSFKAIVSYSKHIYFNTLFLQDNLFNRRLLPFMKIKSVPA